MSARQVPAAVAGLLGYALRRFWTPAAEAHRALPVQAL
jgi:hypothetical protein